MYVVPSSEICKNEGTTGYPTFYLYHQGIKYDEYRQGRTSELFLSYIKNPPPLPAVQAEADDLSESRAPADDKASDKVKAARDQKKDGKTEL